MAGEKLGVDIFSLSMGRSGLRAARFALHAGQRLGG